MLALSVWLNYEHLLTRFNEIEKSSLGIKILLYEKDLKIFVMEGKDIYLIYYTNSFQYCEIGYRWFLKKCIKIKRNCQQSFFYTCDICK